MTTKTTFIPRALHLLATGLLATCAFAATAHADEGPVYGSQHRMHMREGMDPGKAGKHLERMIARHVPDATPEQKTRLNAIAAAAMKDLQPLAAKQRTARAESMKLLAQPTIDRAAVERVRSEQMQIAEARSKRMSQAWTEAAEVLTPAQRLKLAEQAGKHREHRQHHEHMQKKQPS